jgi:hypothetical protein
MVMVMGMVMGMGMRRQQAEDSKKQTADSRLKAWNLLVVVVLLHGGATLL